MKNALKKTTLLAAVAVMGMALAPMIATDANAAAVTVTWKKLGPWLLEHCNEVGDSVCVQIVCTGHTQNGQPIYSCKIYQ